MYNVYMLQLFYIIVGWEGLNFYIGLLRFPLLIELPWGLLAQSERIIFSEPANMRGLITLTPEARWRMAVKVEADAESTKKGLNPVIKHQIQHGCGECASWGRNGLSNLTDETKRSGANKEGKTFLFSKLAETDHTYCS